MSEEEIIDILENVFIFKNTNDNFTDLDLKAIEGLLDLYSKQQKEIKELKEEHNSKYYHTIKLKELENEINNDWENKIKAEIKELEQMGLDDDIFGKMRNYAILILKELLGE